MKRLLSSVLLMLAGLLPLHAAANLIVTSASISATDGRTVTTNWNASLTSSSAIHNCFIVHAYGIYSGSYQPDGVASGTTVTFVMPAPVEASDTPTIDVQVSPTCNITDGSGNTPQGQSGVGTTNNSTWLGASNAPLSSHCRYSGGAAVNSDPFGTGFPHGVSWNFAGGSMECVANPTEIDIWAFDYYNAWSLYQDGLLIYRSAPGTGSTVYKKFVLATNLSGTNHTYRIAQTNDNPYQDSLLPLVNFVGGSASGSPPPYRPLIYGCMDSMGGNGGGPHNYMTGEAGIPSVLSGYGLQMISQAGWSVSTNGGTLTTDLRDYCYTHMIPADGSNPDIGLLDGGANDQAIGIAAGNATTAGTFIGDTVTMIRNIQTSAHPPTRIIYRNVLPNSQSSTGGIYNSGIDTAVAYVNSTYSTNVCVVHTLGVLNPTPYGIRGLDDMVDADHYFGGNSYTDLGAGKVADVLAPVFDGITLGSSFTFTGPTAGLSGVASSNFLFHLRNGVIWNGLQSIALGTAGDGGTWVTPFGTGSSPYTVTPTAGTGDWKAQYVAASTGTKTLTIGSLPDCWTAPASISYSSVSGSATQSIALPATATAANSSIPAETDVCRYEFELQSIPGTLDNGVPVSANNCGFNVQYIASSHQIQIYWNNGNNGTGPCVGNPALISTSSLSAAHAILRLQKTVSAGPAGYGLPANSISIEVWDAATGAYLPVGMARNASYATNVCTYTSLGGPSYTNGVTLGDSGSSAVRTFGFFRQYNTLVPVGSAAPETTPASTTGLVVEWKLDGNANDSSGNGYNATLTNTSGSYVSSAPVQALVISRPRTSDAPWWVDWKSAKVGLLNTLDATYSSTQAAANSTLTYLWAQNLTAVDVNGKPICDGEALTLSSTSAAQPTYTPTVFGPLCWDLTVTDTNGLSAKSTLVMGATVQDLNGVVSHSENPNIGKIELVPIIAFGKNPFNLEDKRNLDAITLQTTAQLSVDKTWKKLNAYGTITYPFAGVGFQPGPACTTLSAAITSATSTTISVTDNRCLFPPASTDGRGNAQTGYPSEIMVGTSTPSLSVELIRIASCLDTMTSMACTSTTTTATLTVAHDGRGMSGNFNNSSAILPAQAWPINTLVGHFRIDGNQTLFSGDAASSICPAGVPGPPGLIVYSTGMVTLSGSTVTASTGSPFTNGNNIYVGDYIRVAATYSSGTPYIATRRITAISGSTMTVDHAFTSDTDGSAFTYAITSVNTTGSHIGMYMSLQATAADGHLFNLLFSSQGCETETQMFAVFTLDIGALDSTVMSGVHYSYQKLASNSTQFSTEFYSAAKAGASLNHRSGYGPARNLFYTISEDYCREPDQADGYFGGFVLNYGGGAVGCMMGKVLNPNTVLSWNNVEQYGVFGGGKAGTDNCNDDDTRNHAYEGMWPKMLGLFDPNASSLGIPTMLTNILAKNQLCKRNSSGGYSGAEINSWANAGYHTSFVGVPMTLTMGQTTATPTGANFTSNMCAGVDTGTITVTHGSAAGLIASGSIGSVVNKIYIWDASDTYLGVFEYTGTGSSGATINFSAQWPQTGGTYSFMTENMDNYSTIWTDANPSDSYAGNEALKESWVCKEIDATHITLNRPWDNTSGSAYLMSQNNTPGWDQQSFMHGGPKMIELMLGSELSDPTLSAGDAAMIPLAANWFNANAWDSVNYHGLLYAVLQQACGTSTDVAAGSFLSLHGQDCGRNGVKDTLQQYTPGGAESRELQGEGGVAMTQYVVYQCTLGSAQCNAAKARALTLYGAVWGDKQFCDASVIAYCDDAIASNLDDSSLGSYKYTGFYFGMGSPFSNGMMAVIADSTGTPIIPRSMPSPKFMSIPGSLQAAIRELDKKYLSNLKLIEFNGK